jgi:protein-tyrosine-phosphatase/predicted ATP-grasp superfamily ATP-dependent carboligase
VNSGKALVLGKDNRSCLTVIRSLGRKGVTVHLGWCSTDSLVRYSTYVKKVHDIPPYSTVDDLWKKELISILQHEKFDLVLPCSDPTLIPLHIHREDLERYGRIYLLSQENFEVVFNKIKMNHIARRLGINLPKEHCVQGAGELEQALGLEMTYPVIVKPQSSFTVRDLSRKNHVKLARSPKDLRKFGKKLLHNGPIQIQEYFEGIGSGVGVLVENGELLFAIQHQRIHEPIGGGGSSYRKTVPLDKDLFSAVKILMEELKYTGIAMVEFRVNLNTGNWIFVELNGRFWGSLPLAVAAGADFPCWLYELLIRNRRVIGSGYKVDLYCRNLGKDINWLKENLFEAGGRFKDRRKLIREVISTIKNVVTFKERNDTLVMDDPKPGIIEIRNILTEIVCRRLGKLRLHLMSLMLGRHLYFKVVTRLVRHSKKILFLCKGNICRSPFSEAYARKVFPKNIVIQSCGYYPEANRVCPQEAILAGREYGVDLTEHRSHVWSRSILEGFDLIFIFDEKNRRSLISAFPDIEKKVYYLGPMALGGTPIIKDPIEGTLDEFRETYAKIARAIENVARALSRGYD